MQNDPGEASSLEQLRDLAHDGTLSLSLRSSIAAHLHSFATKKELKKCTRARSPAFRHRVSRSCTTFAGITFRCRTEST